MAYPVLETTTKQEVLQERYKRRTDNYLKKLSENLQKRLRNLIPVETLRRFRNELMTVAEGYR